MMLPLDHKLVHMLNGKEQHMMRPSGHKLEHKERHMKQPLEHTLVHKVLHMRQLVGHKPAHMQPVRNMMVHDRTSQQMHC
jgi:hypothetical protein